MRKLIDEEILPVVLIIGLLALLPGTVGADSEIIITGVINEDGQLLDGGGVFYEISENEIGDALIKLVGQRVNVEGMLMESEDFLMITVLNFELLDLNSSGKDY